MGGIPIFLFILLQFVIIDLKGKASRPSDTYIRHIPLERVAEVHKKAGKVERHKTWRGKMA